MFACFKKCMQVITKSCAELVPGSYRRHARGLKAHPCRLARDVPYIPARTEGTAQGCAPALTPCQPEPLRVLSSVYSSDRHLAILKPPPLSLPFESSSGHISELRLLSASSHPPPASSLPERHHSLRERFAACHRRHWGSTSAIITLASALCLAGDLEFVRSTVSPPGFPCARFYSHGCLLMQSARFHRP